MFAIPPQELERMQPKTNNLAVISLVLGVLGLVGILPFIGSIGAIITGHMARGQLRMNSNETGDGLALGGLITGYLGVVAACAGVMLFLFVFGGLAMLGIAGAAAGGGG